MPDSLPERGGLSLDAKVGQLLHVGIGHGYLETDVGWPSRDLRRVLETVQPGSLRIYGEHAATPHFVAQYTNRIQAWAADAGHGIPPLIASDCEAGTVEIVSSGARAYPSVMGRTATGDLELAERVARALASDMVAMGMTMSHQPTVDVNTDPRNPVIGVRSPGCDPETVSAYGTALLDGMHAADQVAVAKHFPGHGATDADSHHDLPHVTYDRETLEAVHLPPFRAVIDAGVDCLMTSHIVVDCLDPENPATLSRAVLTDLLRDDIGFDGVVVTDSLSMDAIADEYGIAEAAVRAIDAGVDLVLTGYVDPETVVEVRDEIVAAVESGALSESRIDESVDRLLALKERYGLVDRRQVDPLDALETTGSEDHETVAREAYERSMTVVDDSDLLPLTDSVDCLLTGVRDVRALEPALADAFGTVVSCSAVPDDAGPAVGPVPEFGPESVAERLDTLRSVARSVDVAVVTTFSAGRFPDGQRAVVEGLAADLPVVVVSLGFPNEYGELPAGVAFVATCAQERLGRPDPLPDAACEAVATALGQIPDSGSQLLERITTPAGDRSTRESQ